MSSVGSVLRIGLRLEQMVRMDMLKGVSFGRMMFVLLVSGARTSKMLYGLGMYRSGEREKNHNTERKGPFAYQMPGLLWSICEGRG